MKYLMVLMAVVACTHAALITPREKNPFKFVMEQQGNPQGISTQDLHKICDQCKDFFQKVKDSIGDFGKLTKEKLTKAINDVCKKLPEDLPGKHEICKVWTPKIVDYIYQYFKDLQEEVQPEKTCQLVFLCPRHPRTTTRLPLTTTTDGPELPTLPILH